MTDRGIIFSASMVCALVEGWKTQTRRLGDSPLHKAQIVDRLWVRENVQAIELANGLDVLRYPATGTDIPIESTVEAAGQWLAMSYYDRKRRPRCSVVPSIHMPRWASRLTLIVEEVRFQPLQAISEGDCIAEGPRVKGYADFGSLNTLNGIMVETDQANVYATPRCWYRELWSSFHTQEGQRWDDNPQIVALTFRVVRENIDRIAA